MIPAAEDHDEEERIEHVEHEEAAASALEEVMDVDPEASSLEIDSDVLVLRRSSDAASVRPRTGSTAETTGRNISRPGISPWNDNIKEKEPRRSPLPGLTLSPSTQARIASCPSPSPETLSIWLCPRGVPEQLTKGLGYWGVL